MKRKQILLQVLKTILVTNPFNCAEHYEKLTVLSTLEGSGDQFTCY